jgi:predicted secreted hydrolase
MRSDVRAWVLLMIWVWPVVGQSPYKFAAPGYKYEFPRDYFNHPKFQTEWWYYTGNVTAKDGRRFGFEMTFFREGVNRDATKEDIWDIRDLYVAHLALSDLDGKSFYHTERTNRAGPGIAGADENQSRIWNGNWKVEWNGEDESLQALDERFGLTLNLHPQKPPVIHGENGISQKAEGGGHASHYISLTRLETSGTIRLNGKSFAVTGLAWMDHEFFTEQLGKDQVGWDWFSMQLSDDTELMLYRMRRKDGSLDPYSAGTYIDQKGHALHLRAQDFSLLPGQEIWRSPLTAAVYPVHWKILVPQLEITLEATTQLNSQELADKSNWFPNYWEGAIELQGQRNHSAVRGVGYLEMTGYDHPVKLSEPN